MEPGTVRTIRVNGVGVAFRWCPPGVFSMGSPASEYWRGKDENQRTVELGGGFWMAETEVTQELYDIITSRNKSLFKGDKLPVHNVITPLPNCITAAPEESMAKIIDLMVGNDVSAVVLIKKDIPVGIITIKDILEDFGR